jgi:hypothetical protein
MSTIIESVTIVCSQGVKTYEVGGVYNGLTVCNILDKSMEYPDCITIIYVGYTEEKDIVFKAINAPVDVSYCKKEAV